jgi:hypothetical protein
MVHYHEDYLKGTKAQHEIFADVVKYFADYDISGCIVENLQEYAKYDYESDDMVFEVKTRFDVARTTYKTTMMTCNKITDTKKGIIFIFNFTDEISWIQYDAELFNTFERKQFSRAGIESDEKEYFYIPVHLLETIKKKPSKCLIKLKKPNQI